MFAHPLGLLALLALPAIAALHLFRRRFEPRAVSALFLWQSVDRTPVAGRERQPLRASASLLLELLAAAALAFALAGPRPGSTRTEHLVIVLDGSASMSARAGESTARERAIEEVERRLNGLDSDSRVTVIESGERPRILAGPTAFAREAREALAKYEPRSTHHDLTPATALALELSGGKRIVVLTDRFDAAAFPREVELVAVGSSESNFGFVHAVRTRERSGVTGEPVERVFLSVAHWGPGPARSTLSLVAGERTLQTKELELGPGEKASFGFELPAGAPAVEARLAADALAVDDRVWLAPVPPRTIALWSDLDPRTHALLGLGDPRGPEGNFARWLEVVPDAVAAESAELAHLALVADVGGGAATSLVLLDRPDGAPHDWVGPFLVEKRHRAFEGVTFDGVVWSAAEGEPLIGAPLVSAGNLALLTEQPNGARTVWRLRLDPERSTLARSPDWPILLSNLAEIRRSELPGLARTNVSIGESVVYRAGAELAAARAEKRPYVLVAPDGARREIPARGEFVLDGLDRAGTWELSVGAIVVGRLAVSFVDPRESDLAPRGSGRRPAEVSADAPEVDFAWPELLLVALALAAVLLDFFVLARGARRLELFAPSAGTGAV